MNYKVSIILPVYNVEKFLRKCLETLVGQSLKEIEIVAINDCSSDKSLEILNEYQRNYGDRFQIIDSKENIKQGGARNLGIKKARGEYIGFVDPDDYVSLDMFEKMYLSAKENNSDIVTCDYYEVLKGESCYKFNDIPEGELNKESTKLILQRKYGWELWQQLYKRNLFVENSIEFSENLYVTDLEIGAIIFMYAKKISKVREALYYYVKHDAATTTFKLNDKKIYDLITVSDNRIQHFIKRGFYEEFKEEIDYIYFWHICVVSVPRCVINFSKPQYKKINEIKSKIIRVIPDIRDNQYYKRSNFFSKLILELLLKNKYILVFLLKSEKLIPFSITTKIKKLLRG
ncbi:hypothetical protein BIV60_20390 [Bacillus sp. MUM 116]|uniref:glycosyltransferase n=1 Tax=Bacillus sp. MUM 116 TaxID=1678002 RepID=UPI0008F57903|nr:glycosyltransferase [Bacillus sp. MUM 116]OIK10582.1 hypothetical protein BIV60_20390 [Bacillus sp. MUM 116]